MYGTPVLLTNSISTGPWKLRESGSLERGDHALHDRFRSLLDIEMWICFYDVLNTGSGVPYGIMVPQRVTTSYVEFERA
jgi:hypothetical protein